MVGEPNEQRVALITGGARRVGRAIVEELRAKNFRVLFTFRTHRPGDTWLQNSDAIQADLTDPIAAADQIFKAVRERTPRLDLLVNCASKYEPDPTDWLAMFDINHRGPVALIHALTPLLRKPNGSVINMLDILVERPMPSYATYCASKAAFWNSTLALARDLAPNVRVNGIAPGVVDWPDAMPQADKDRYLERVPLRRAGTPSDVAKLVHFLSVEGTYITGQVIRLDGGRSIA